jgi:hypothetical protein
MFSADQFALLLSPKAWAAQILDRVKAGEPIPRSTIDMALEFSGDLPRIIEGRLHELEPVQAAHRGAAGGQ